MICHIAAQTLDDFGLGKAAAAVAIDSIDPEVWSVVIGTDWTGIFGHKA